MASRHVDSVALSGCQPRHRDGIAVDGCSCFEQLLKGAVVANLLHDSNTVVHACDGAVHVLLFALQFGCQRLRYLRMQRNKNAHF